MKECTVPSVDYPTIQSALKDATCDVIQVKAGVYKEKLAITRAVKLLGESAATTVLEGEGTGPIVCITDGAAPVIDGFTVTGGNATTNNGRGGGIYIKGATLTLAHCNIVDNIASSDLNVFGKGGGLYAEATTVPLQIQANNFNNNVGFSVPMHFTVIENKGGGNGGGLALGPGASADITGNTFRGNIGFTRGDDTGFPYLGQTWGGGGIYTEGDTVNIDGNTIADNFGGLRGNVGHGGAVNIASGIVTLTRNKIYRNTALVDGCFGQGGAVNATAQFRSLTITDNDFEGNTGVLSGHSPMPSSFISCGGGAVHIFARVAPPDNISTIRENRFVNNILAQAIVGSGGQGAIIGGGAGALYAARCNTAIFEKNIVRGNVAVENVSLSGSGAFGGGQGGGVVFQAVQNLTVDNNEVTGNATCKRLVNYGAISTNDGGGISVWRSPNAVVTNNLVEGNMGVETATFIAHDDLGIYAVRGGGIYINDVELPDFDGPPNYGSHAVVRGNRVLNNMGVKTLNVIGGAAPAMAMGGGIFVGNIANVEITDNVVRGNVNAETQTPNVYSDYAGIALYKVGALTMKDNIDENNTPYAQPQAWAYRALPRSAETKHFKVGDIECIAISDGHLAYMFPTGFLFGNAPQAELQQALAEFNFPADYWTGTYTCLIIKTGGRCILVDTGPGKAAPSTGHLLQNLQAEGIKPEDIDTVIITHAHPDHIGGNVDNLGKSNFPNARFILWKSEWDFWTINPDLSQLQAPDFFKFNLLIFNGSQLPLIASQVDIITDGTEIAPGVSAIPLPGHTPGQIGIKVASKGEEFLYISDAVLHPIHVAHPEWLSMLDLNAEQTIASRRKLFEMVADTKTVLMGYHFDFPAMGRIVKKGDGWSWESL